MKPEYISLCAGSTGVVKTQLELQLRIVRPWASQPLHEIPNSHTVYLGRWGRLMVLSELRIRKSSECIEVVVVCTSV